MKALEKSCIYRISEGVKSREESFGLLIVSRKAPAMSLNNDAKTVWNLIDGERTVSDIIASISDQYVNGDVEERVLEIMNGFLRIELITTK